MPTPTSAIITWTTDQASSSQVEYGTSTSYGTVTPLDPARVLNHSVTLTGLTPSITYFYRTTSRNAAGIATQAIGSFMTASSGTATLVITWTTSQQASSQVEYGLSTGYGSVTPLDPSRGFNHTVTITGLQPGTTYFYRAKSRNAAGILTQQTGSATTAGGTVLPFTVKQSLLKGNAQLKTVSAALSGATGVVTIGPIGFVGSGGPGATPATGVVTIGPILASGNGGPAAVIILPPASTALAPPVPIVEVAFSSDPFLAPIWVNISKYVESFTINRGRSRELNQMGAGTLNIVLSGIDRSFDPTWVGSPYYPYVLPGRRIRVRASYNNSIYSLYSGYIESWGQEWQGYQDATVPITASDGFKMLNLAQLTTAFPVQTSDARIKAVLDVIGWTLGGPQWILGDPVMSILGSTTILGPTGDRRIGPGQAIVAAADFTGSSSTSALQHLQDVATSEFGLLFADHDGLITFYGRNHQVNVTTNYATFGEQELPYVNVAMAYDDSDLWTDVRVTASSGNVRVAGDPVVQKRFGLPRTLPVSTLLNSDAQAQQLANLLYSKYGLPALQVVGMTLDGAADPANLYPHMLGRDLGEQVTVRRRPQFGGSTIEQFSTIQGINVSYTAEGADWRTEWRLSPTDKTTYWVLGDPVLSILGQTTRLFF